jgi:AcrR family transcriptional regulator
MRLFAEQGYASTTTAQIEQAIGLSPGSGGLFRHFESKQALLEAAVERALTRRSDHPPGPFTSPSQALAQSVLRLVDADPALWRLLLRDGASLPLDTDALYARLVQPAFEQAVAWARLEIEDSPDVRARIVVGISALMYLRVSEYVYGRTPADMEEAQFIDVVERLFGGLSG